MNDNLFGQLVRNERLIRGLAARGVAATLSISAQYLSDLELGRRVPPDDTDMLATWAGILDIPPRSLWQRALCARDPRLCQTLGIDDMAPELAEEWGG